MRFMGDESSQMWAFTNLLGSVLGLDEQVQLSHRTFQRAGTLTSTHAVLLTLLLHRSAHVRGIQSCKSAVCLENVGTIFAALVTGIVV
jgi:hypothetical protein